jgi:NTE family protein
MVFHVGTLWRLNELGFLPRLARISSVSGGSITAGVLGARWGRLDFQGEVAQRFDEEVVAPLRALGARSIDAESIIGGILTPSSIGDKIAREYDEYLFRGATLQDLPDDPPRFVINATNVQSGALWRFMKPAMRDYRVGSVPSPRLKLSVAVAASSAFPPVLSPVTLELNPSDFAPPEASEDLHREPYTSQVVLSDGGVYDNLGLETAWKRYDTVLVSDAGGKMRPEEEPKRDWVRHSLRILDVIDNQVRSLRKRQLINAFQENVRKGAYWGIRTDIRNYGVADALTCPVERTTELADLKTRLKRLEPTTQERLINWGYAVCDAALRRHVDPTLPPPRDFPYPSARV